MTATVFLEDPIDGGEYKIDCEVARVIGNVVWAVPEGEDRDTVVPMENVSAMKGDVVEQQVEEIESPGGRFTELVTELQ